MPDTLIREEVPDLYGSNEAVYSPDQVYRYLLIRRWAPGPLATFLMLNPSIATATIDDPTIRRCRAYARREACGGMTILNLFALRATDPRELYHHADPIGPRTDEFIAENALPGSLVVAAFGTHGALAGRGDEVTRTLAARGVELRCLGYTAGGFPRHPLYVRADAPLIPYAPEATSS
jgi:hypothetical protein